MVDLDSKRLLFRAAGTHASKGTTAEAYSRHQYDKHQSSDFESAMHMMVSNLGMELLNFDHRLKEKRPGDDIKVKARPGYQMAVEWSMVCLLGLFLL